MTNKITKNLYQTSGKLNPKLNKLGYSLETFIKKMDDHKNHRTQWNKASLLVERENIIHDIPIIARKYKIKIIKPVNIDDFYQLCLSKISKKEKKREEIEAELELELECENPYKYSFKKNTSTKNNQKTEIDRLVTKYLECFQNQEITREYLFAIQHLINTFVDSNTKDYQTFYRNMKKFLENPNANSIIVSEISLCFPDFSKKKIDQLGIFFQMFQRGFQKFLDTELISENRMIYWMAKELIPEKVHLLSPKVSLPKRLNRVREEENK